MHRGWIVGGALTLVAAPVVPAAAAGVSMVLDRVDDSGLRWIVRTGDVLRYRVSLTGAARHARLAVAASPATALTAVTCPVENSGTATAPGVTAIPEQPGAPGAASGGEPAEAPVRTDSGPPVGGGRAARLPATRVLADEASGRARMPVPGTKRCPLGDFSGSRAVDVVLTVPEGTDQVSLSAVAEMRQGGGRTSLARTTTVGVTSSSDAIGSGEDAVPRTPDGMPPQPSAMDEGAASELQEHAPLARGQQEGILPAERGRRQDAPAAGQGSGEGTPSAGGEEGGWRVGAERPEADEGGRQTGQAGRKPGGGCDSGGGGKPGGGGDSDSGGKPGGDGRSNALPDGGRLDGGSDGRSSSPGRVRTPQSRSGEHRRRVQAAVPEGALTAVPPDGLSSGPVSSGSVASRAPAPSGALAAPGGVASGRGASGGRAPSDGMAASGGALSVEGGPKGAYGGSGAAQAVGAPLARELAVAPVRASHEEPVRPLTGWRGLAAVAVGIGLLLGVLWLISRAVRARTRGTVW